MDAFRIVCPNCGLSRTVPKDKLPPRPVKATCPGCKHVFAFDPATALPATDEPVKDGAPPPSGPTPPPQPSASPPPPPSERPSLPPPPRPGRNLPSGTAEMLGIGELLKSAWAAFQARFGTLFCIYLLLILFMIVPLSIGAGIGVLLSLALPSMKGAMVAVFGALGGIAGLVGSSWGGGAFFAAALDDGLDVRGAFAAAKPKILSFIWVSFLVGCIVSGGFFLFIIPGIVFAVWFLMAPMIVIDDEPRGMSALLKSRALANGRWFDVFLRLLAMWACSALIGAIPAVGPLLVIVATPYLVLYQALLYKDIQRVAEPVAYGCSFWEKARWPLVALLGYVAVPLALLACFGMSYLPQLKLLLDGNGVNQIMTVQSGMSSPKEGEWRVIPVPGSGAKPEASETLGTSPAPSPSSSSLLPDTSLVPEDIHVFIYAVNCGGRVLANGEELKQLETKPDMQYNYNMFGDKLRYGQNTISVEYSPMTVTGNMLEPQIHIKISRLSGGERQVLGEWRINETSSGQQSFDLDIPQSQ